MSNTITFTWTGAQIKAACVNPSVNMDETVIMATDLLNQSGPVVIMNGYIQGSRVGTLTAAYALVPATLSSWVEEDSFQPGDVPIGRIISDAKIRLRVRVYDVGTHLSDIPDTATVTLVATINKVAAAPGSDTATDLTALATVVSGLTPAVKTFTNPSRSLNTAFQISTAKDALVSYAVDVATTLSLTSGAVGTTYLRYADDSAFTTNVKEVGRFVNGNTGSLTVGLNLNQTSTATLTGMVPAGKYAKLVTENTTGTPTFTFRSAQEILV